MRGRKFESNAEVIRENQTFKTLFCVQRTWVIKMGRNISYDGTFKETLDGFTGEDIIELINELFQRDYPRNSEVIRLATESHADGEERRSDSVLRIGGESMYHIEIQSSPDKTITLRVFEYAYRVAMQHGKTQGKDYLKLDFPKTVVFYLRSDEKTPRELSIELNLPDGSTAAYTVPTKRLEEYKPEDLVKKSMLIFAPFYSMLWEKKLEHNPAAFEELKAAVLFISDGINERLQKGEISKKSADFAVNALRCVFKNVLDKAKLNQQEVTNYHKSIGNQHN
ncbi:MAG: hypothetical protein FWG70_11550 [Oscillospiraceae bacterium]|nr:hypothetical protein [Oscillospiraceae bacterium]